MQQPLCHLYFLTVMEHLWTTHLSKLVHLAEHIQKQLKTAEGGEAIILRVELQAVVQVLIQRLAEHLNPLQIRKFGDVQSSVKDINKLELCRYGVTSRTVIQVHNDKSVLHKTQYSCLV